MSWVDRLNTGLRGTINRGTDNILESRSGMKADQNLERLADRMETVLQDKLEKSVRLYTKKIFYLRQEEPLQMIHLNYYLENRLLSKIYDLHIKGRVETLEAAEIGNVDIIFKHRNFSNKKPCFTGQANEAALSEILQQLNNPLIIERIQKLDLSELYLQYKENENCWEISSRSIIGSCVSLIFPPLTRGIAMQPQEIVLLYELYSMIAAVLKNKSIDKEK